MLPHGLVQKGPIYGEYQIQTCLSKSTIKITNLPPENWLKGKLKQYKLAFPSCYRHPNQASRRFVTRLDRALHVCSVGRQDTTLAGRLADFCVCGLVAWSWDPMGRLVCVCDVTWLCVWHECVWHDSYMYESTSHDVWYGVALVSRID